MLKNTNTITTMGIISDEVYADKNQKYFQDELNSDGSKKEVYLEANNHTYKVLDHTPTQDTSFNALLLQDKDTDKYIIAFRGTAENFDIFDDAVVGLKNYSFEFTQAKAFVSDMLKKHAIDKESLTLTGHSLGGILTQAVGAVYKIAGVAFNPYGVDRLLCMPPLPALGSPLSDIVGGMLHTAAYKIGTLFGLEAPETTWAHEHITNVHYVDEGTLNGDPLSNLATELSSKHLGSSLLIYGEDKGMDGHSMPVLNDAIAKQNDTLKHFKGATLQSLNEIYSVTGYEKAQEIFKTLEIEKSSPRSLRLESLYDKEIEEYDLQDPATLYALEHLNPFAVEGNLDAYKKIEIDNYSKEQLSDRVAFYYEKIHDTNRDTLYRDLQEALPKYANPDDIGKEKVVFGTDNNDKLSGMEKDDHLYGNSGNDTIHGDIAELTQSNDHLEGGKGMDTLYGGKGDDTLIGGYGGGKDDNAIDVLYGGEGFDTYYVNDKDMIQDSDNVGRIVFNGISLSGEKQKIEEHRYIDTHFNYDYSPEDKRLTVVDRATQAQIVIEQFEPSSDALGIVLDASQIIPQNKETQEKISLPSNTTPFVKLLPSEEAYLEVDLHDVSPLTLSTLITHLPDEMIEQAHVQVKAEDVITIKGKKEAVVEENDTLQEVLKHTKLTTPQLLERNPWLVERGRVSFLENTRIETHVDHLSIYDRVRYEKIVEAFSSQEEPNNSVVDENENTLTQAKRDNDTQETQEDNAGTLTKEQKSLQNLYPHLYQDNNSDDNEREVNDLGFSS